MDYTVRDSSVVPHFNTRAVREGADYSVRVGMVRKILTLDSGETRYIVEVASGGRQIPVSCVPMVRFGGAHNFEEFVLRPWIKTFSAENLPDSAFSEYNLRSGDVVLVAYLEGQAREGVILGGLSHPARSATTSPGDVEYNSRFNGIETIIKKDGSYKVSFNGAAVNDALLDTPPTGVSVPEPQYSPFSAGSFFGFSSAGSFVAADGAGQFIKVGKDSGSVTIQSGGTVVTVGQAGLVGIKSMAVTINTFNFKMETVDFALNSAQFSVMAGQVSIGNDGFELIDGLIKLIDAIGNLVITSPVGTCTPINLSPTWVSDVEALKAQMSTLKAGLLDVDANFSADSSGDIA